MKRIALGMISAAFAVSTAQAQDLSLESIFDLESTVASKKAVKQSDAPGVITVYTEDDIKRLGYETLAQLASITPGYSSANIFAGMSNFIVRGQTQTGFENNKVLVLVDGLPVNHLRNTRAPMDEDLTLMGVEKVEFLKGPASALYGTGAFFGVIKVTTKKAKEGETEVAARVYNGNYDAQGVHGYATTNKDGYVTSFRASRDLRNPSLKMRGYKPGTDTPEDEGNRGTGGAANWLFDRNESTHLSSEVKVNEGGLSGLSVGYEANSTRRGTFEANGWAGAAYNANTYRFDYSHTYLKYDKKINDKTEFNSYLKYAMATEEGTAYLYNMNFMGIEALAEVTHDLTEKGSIVAGLNYDSRKAQDYKHGTIQGDSDNHTDEDKFVEAGSDPIQTASAYAQYSDEFGIGRGLLVTAGLRLDTAKTDTSDVNQLSPRLSLVQRLTEAMNLKVLYGTALKAPDLKSTLVNQGVLAKGGTLFQDKLSPETISSLEMGLTYNLANISSSLTYFNTAAKDVISRRTFAGEGTYRNDSGESKTQGVELDFKAAVLGGDTLFLNYTYADAKLPDNNDGTLEGQRPAGAIQQNASVGYLSRVGAWSFAGAVKWVGGIIADSVNGVDDVKEKTYPSFVTVDANVIWSYSKHLEFGFQAINLTGSEVRVGSFGEVYNPQAYLVSAGYTF